ncbi:MAG: hypothetical protein M9962_00855 [Oligoflexia bacterium]|nr:hypothetical protein [Oligoflexia bacterium]
MKKLILIIVCLTFFSCTKKEEQKVTELVSVSCFDLINGGYKANQEFNAKLKMIKEGLAQTDEKPDSQASKAEEIEVYLFSDKEIDKKIREEFSRVQDKLEGFEKMELILSEAKNSVASRCRSVFSEVATNCKADPVDSVEFQNCVKKELDQTKKDTIGILMGEIAGYKDFEKKLEDLK